MTASKDVPGLSARQLAFLLVEEREALFGGSAGGGKAIDVNELIPTPSGLVPMRDIHPGDEVFGTDGNTCTVLAESDIHTKPTYLLTFDDGSSVAAADDHLWLTFSNSELTKLARRTPEFRARRRATRPSRAQDNPSKGLLHQQTVITRNKTNNPSKPKPPPTGTVRTTQEIVDTLTVYGGRANHAIPVADTLSLPEADLLIDPYLLGCWLGDGTARRAEITTADDEVIDAFREQFEVSYRYDRGKASTYGLLKFLTLLKQLNLVRNKHIPHEYLWGSERQRLDLLQGLMDTDGTVAKASVEFTNTNRSLVEGAAFLARSLGMKASVRENRATLNGVDHGPVWSTKFAANRIVFRIKRKADKQSLASRQTTRFRYVKDAKFLGDLDVKCIQVSSPDSLFLATKHLIPTHNSESLLQTATQYVDDYPTASLILRRSYRDLDKPGGLMFRSREWFTGTKAHWDGINYRWIFPSGATINFGYIEHAGDELKFQSSEYQAVLYDELTHFSEQQYLYLFSRLRRLQDSPVPLRMRSGTNPGGPGHEWVRKRWNLPGGPPPGSGRVFVRSTLRDNPFLRQDEYIEGLNQLGDVTRAQLLEGDWSATSTGGFFQAGNFRLCEWGEVPPATEFAAIVRYWDFAATEPTDLNPDPDYTVGLKIGITLTGSSDPLLPDWYVFDVERFRGNPGTVEARIKATAERDGKNVVQWLEQERGSAGKHLFRHYSVNVLPDRTVRPLYATGTKEARASIAAARANEGRIFLVDGPWREDFIAECATFPLGGHDDQVDGLSNGIISLEKERHYSSQGRVSKRGRDMKPVRRTRNVEARRHIGY